MEGEKSERLRGGGDERERQRLRGVEMRETERWRCVCVGVVGRGVEMEAQ